jgi:hypothetical protein
MPNRSGCAASCAMTGLSAGPAHALAAKFPWKEYTTFMDIGAAQGTVPVTLARTHPHLRGVGFDLPPVQPVFEEFVANHGLSDRVRFHAGDFFAEVLPNADVIVIGHILHDWDVSQKKELLSKAFTAVPNGGAVIVYDAIIDDERRENVFGLLMSLNMLIETPAGFDYTGADCRQWMREVGFPKTRVEHLVGPDSMVIGAKRTPTASCILRRLASYRPQISFEHDVEWKAAISRYMSVIPLNVDECCVTAQRIFGSPSPRAVSSAMRAKVGAAARHSQLAMPCAANSRLFPIACFSPDGCDVMRISDTTGPQRLPVPRSSECPASSEGHWTMGRPAMR